MARILLVDDERDLADEVGRLLESDGHTVDVAYRYREATDLFRRNEYDLVVFDIIMPVEEADGLDPETVGYGRETGVAVYNFIRERRPTQRVIATTVVRSESILGKLRGADAILKKPFFAEELLGKVRQVLTGGR